MTLFNWNKNCFLTTNCVLFRHLLRDAELVIISFFRHQLVMGPELHHLSVFQKQDMVSEANGRESMGDNNACMLFNIRK